jgi:DNA-binding transcriptional MerR regulator
LDRITVSEAAHRLGVTPDAVRQRIRRGTIQHDKDPDGRTYVYLDPEATRRDNVSDASRNELVQSMQDQIATLKCELEDWKEEARRKDTIIMTMAQRIPELEPASEPRESPASTIKRDGTEEEPPENREKAAERSWWRRLFS